MSAEPKVLHEWNWEGYDLRVVEVRQEHGVVQEREGDKWYRREVCDYAVGDEIASLASRLRAAEAACNDYRREKFHLLDVVATAEAGRDEARKLVVALADELKEALSWACIPRHPRAELHLRNSQALLARARSLGATPAPFTPDPKVQQALHEFAEAPRTEDGWIADPPAPETEPAASPEVVDLMEALKRELGEGKP